VTSEYFTLEEREGIKQEVLDRFDIYDILTLLDLELEVLYDRLEEDILDNLEILEIEHGKYSDSWE
jgi:hypothetical protein